MNLFQHPILEGNCYVLHSDFYHPILRGKYDGVVLYPERGESLLRLKTGYKFDKSIITECAELIALYDRSKVWIWTKDEENSEGYWENPDRQTYCASYEYIEDFCLGFNNSIPLGGVLGKQKYEKLKNLYL